MGKKLPKSVKPEEFKRLINYSLVKTKHTSKKDFRMMVAFVLAYGSGLRVSEVVKLKKENIGETRIEIWDAKGGKDRVVPRPKGWRDWMMKFIPINRHIRTLERSFRIYKQRAGLPDYYVFHSLRHGFATRMIEQGVPINYVQTLMGHSHISTTGIYLKARPEDALRSYEDLF